MRREITIILTNISVSIDNLPLGGRSSKLFIKPALEMSSKETNCLVRQLCGKNWRTTATGI